MLQQALRCSRSVHHGDSSSKPTRLTRWLSRETIRAIGIEGLQPRSPNSVALTARIGLNFGAQNQAWAWVLAIPLTGPTWWSDLNARAVGKGRLWGNTCRLAVAGAQA